MITDQISIIIDEYIAKSYFDKLLTFQPNGTLTFPMVRNLMNTNGGKGKPKSYMLLA
jgi:hypothetical protein